MLTNSPSTHVDHHVTNTKQEKQKKFSSKLNLILLNWYLLYNNTRLILWCDIRSRRVDLTPNMQKFLRTSKIVGDSKVGGILSDSSPLAIPFLLNPFSKKFPSGTAPLHIPNSLVELEIRGLGITSCFCRHELELLLLGLGVCF